MNKTERIQIEDRSDCLDLIAVKGAHNGVL